MKYTSQRGTKDILPDEINIWQHIENLFHSTFKKFGYCEIRTPIFEQTDLFVRGIGGSTDIVSKEMYTFLDKGERSVTLRPEGTAPIVRSAIQNNLLSKDKITKLYYIGPMFRYERPQAGRYRQFNQAGVEVFGSSSPFVDADVISSCINYFELLGIKSLEVNLNSVGCFTCRPKFVEKLKNSLEKSLTDLCLDCKERFVSNPLRILDCKNESCKKIISSVMPEINYLCDDCKEHLHDLLEALLSINRNVKINPNLVRGLDYYTKTTFEIISNELGAQNAVCGGGRYDTLVKEMGGQDIPAFGFALGIERLIEVIKAQNISAPKNNGLFIYLITLGDEAQKKSFKILNDLRKNGFSSDMNYFNKSLKSQLKNADNLCAKYVLIIGDDEIKKNIFILRNMETMEQKEIDEEGLMKELNEKK